METIRVYEEQQNQNIQKLKKLLKIINEGHEFGVEIDSSMIKRIETGIEKCQEDKLKVALIGGFSEGKTSIAAAWIEKYDKESMQISILESTDGVQVYDVDDKLKLIDTPGLFGFKETADKEKYKDITKKYVSEADLVLYVMNSTNPIKETHKEELIWLFKDLCLLDRTIFVLSRFDEVADVEDEEDYLENYMIKKTNVISRLIDFNIITNEEIDIVAVSADPFEQGISVWLENIEEYKKFSHISLLQNATTNKIVKCGGKNKIINDAQQSIMRYVVCVAIPKAEETMNTIDNELESLKKVYNDVENDFNHLQDNMVETRINLRQFIINYFRDLILKTQALDHESIVEFFEAEIGDNGIVMDTTIQNEFEKEVGVILSKITKCECSLDAATSHYTNTVGALAKQGIKQGADFLKKGNVRINANHVKAIRDVFFKNVKFKPWQAVKIADKLVKGVAILGVAVDIGMKIWESIDEKKKNEELEKNKENLKNMFVKQREEYIRFINNDLEYSKLFNPNYENFDRKLNSVLEEINSKDQMKRNFQNWKKEFEIIDAEFKVISE